MTNHETRRSAYLAEGLNSGGFNAEWSGMPGGSAQDQNRCQTCSIKLGNKAIFIA